MTKIVCISDTHNALNEIVFPEGDILIHAGDLTGFGRAEEIDSQLKIMDKLDYQIKILTPGNHDFLFQNDPRLSKKILRRYKTISYLQNNGAKFLGLNVYACPYMPRFGGWAFMERAGSSELESRFRRIPENIDILITHCPPFEILDKSLIGHNCGCQILRDQILQRIKPKLHVFGHIHESHGVYKTEETTFVNASIMDRQYSVHFEPIVIEI